jgi:FlaA1/EpsC-like NDP-sugar epimerase
MISLDQGVELVWSAFDDMVGGEIYVKKIPSMKVVDIARTIAPAGEFDEIGIRPGEKLHEMMISSEDARTTYEYKGYYKILPQIHDWSDDVIRIKDGKHCPEGFAYASDTNAEWMTPGELRDWMKEEYRDSASK